VDDDEFLAEFHAKIVETGTLKGACRLLGLPPSVAQEWLEEGARLAERAYAENRIGHLLEPEALLWLAWQAAQGERDRGLFQRVRDAEGWQAAWKLLESLDRESFGDRVQVTGADGGAIQIDHPDVAEAIERFTSAVVSLAQRSGSDPAHGLPDGRGEGPAGLPVGRVAGEAESASS